MQTVNCSLQLRVCSFTLSGFRFQQSARCLVQPCCYSSSRSASLLTPLKHEEFIVLSKFKNLTGTSQAGVETYLLFLKIRLAVQFLVTKNLAINHLPLEAPPAVQTREEL